MGQKIRLTNKSKFIFLFVYWLIVCILLLLTSEIFTYSGFIYKHLGLSINFLTILVIVIWQYIVFYLKEGGLIYDNLKKISLFGFIALLISWVLFSFVEAINYPNYVFSRFHVNLEAFKVPIYIFAFFLLTDIFSKAKLEYLRSNFKKISSISFKKQFLPVTRVILITVVLLFILFNNFSLLFNLFKKRVVFMIDHPSATYQEKMEEAIGADFFKFMNFVVENTPEDARILIPPQGYPWPQTGNRFYARSFLYPRTLVNGGEHEAIVDSVDYVLIAWGESTASQYGFTNGWPKFDVKSEQILTLGGEVILNKNYIFKTDMKKYKWGIIKLKK